jgi:chromosome segregation ATPase
MTSGDEPRSDDRRFDAAHVIRPSEPHRLPVQQSALQFVATGKEDSAVGNAIALEHSVEQLRAHATQLADRLQSERDEVDERASQLAAREADLDAKFRNAQQWLEEQRHELDERAEQLDSQQTAIVERESTLEARATELTHVRVQALAEQEARLRDAQAAISARETDLTERLAALDIDRTAWTERREQLERRETAVEARHRELDHRQGELYQVIEEFSTEKAGFGDRVAEIDRREQQVAQWEARLESQVASLDAQTQSLRDRAGELEMERAELRHRVTELAGREKELAAAEKQFAFRQQEIASALERFERLGVTESRMQELQAEAAEFAARRRYLDEAEQQLTDEKAQLAEQVRELDRQRRQFQETTARQQRLLAGHEQQARKEQQQRDEQLNQREAELDSREAAIEQLGAELRHTEREALEMRLATEETWNQLAGALAPASLTRSISIVRAKLADHYRQTLESIAAKSRELESVRRDLAEQLDALETQRHELQQWAERRHEDIEHQAARLVAREQELDRQQQHYEQLESRWHLEQIEYQAEIRRLLAALRTVELKAA